MEMHQLRYLEAVARSGSMMAAAAACHVSQPALSVQIKKLEEEIGAPLFIRGPRGTELTPAGERTLLASRKILREVELLQTDAKRRTFHQRPILRVAVQPHLATELLPRLLGGTLSNTSRGLRLEFRERMPERVVASVRSGGSDLGLLDLATTPIEAMESEELARIPYALFCRPDHPLAHKSGVKLAHLLDHAVLLFEHSPGLAQRLHALAERKGKELNAPFSSEYAVTVFEFVASGAGIAVLPVSFAARARRRHLAIRPLSDYTEQTVVGAIWRPDLAPVPFIQETLEHLRQGAATWAPPD